MNQNKDSQATVVVINSMAVVREFLVQTLSESKAVSVSHSFSKPSSALDVIYESRPDVVLLDVTTTGNTEWIARILSVSPAISIIVWGVPLVEREVLAYAKCGAAGYITSEDTATQLVSSVVAAVNGELANPKIAALLNKYIYDNFRQSQSDSNLETLPDKTPATESSRNLSKLTARELEVVKLIDQGLSNKEIARKLNVELSTTKNHVHSILRKFHVSRRIMAAAEFRSQDKNVVQI